MPVGIWLIKGKDLKEREKVEGQIVLAVDDNGTTRAAPLEFFFK